VSDDHQHAQHGPHDRVVVLDIGGKLGALIVYTDPALLHTEIEISPDGDDDRRSHKDVLERFVADRSLYAAVFDRLPTGAYTLWHDGEARTRGTTVTGGVVSEIDWRARPAATKR